MRVGNAGLGRLRGDLGRRETHGQRLVHVGRVGRQKQVRAQGPQVAKRRRPLRENPALHRRQPVGLGRAEHAHAADRVVARQHHHLHPLLRGLVEGQQLLDQRKRHARPRWNIQPVELQLHVALRVVRVEEAVFFFKIEQCARRNRHHQLVVQCHGHGASLSAIDCLRESRSL